MKHMIADYAANTLVSIEDTLDLHNHFYSGYYPEEEMMGDESWLGEMADDCYSHIMFSAPSYVIDETTGEYVEV